MDILRQVWMFKLCMSECHVFAISVRMYVCMYVF
jgi:hypothetical protein